MVPAVGAFKESILRISSVEGIPPRLTILPLQNRLRVAHRRISRRTERAIGMVEDAYRKIVDAGRKEDSKSIVEGNGSSECQKDLPQNGFYPEILRKCDLVLRIKVPDYARVLIICSDCSMIHVNMRNEEVVSILENLSPEQRTYLRIVSHVLNGINNPPMTASEIVNNALEDLSCVYCWFCARDNRYAEKIRAVQEKMNFSSCYGSCFDSCTKMKAGVCEYLFFDEDLRPPFCVIPQECLRIDEVGLWGTWFNYWPRILRVLALKEKGFFNWELNRIDH